MANIEGGQMTPEAQRIAIAEACGWKQSTYAKEGRIGIGDYEVWVSPQGRVFDRYVEQGAEKENTYLPDYLNDLNAMHEAEKVLTAAQYNKYASNFLPTVCLHSGHYAVCATAAQRAEAFLRTLNLWKETSRQQTSNLKENTHNEKANRGIA